ncbi:uncharacterized protein LOC144102475 [Amblyomma americanum]
MADMMQPTSPEASSPWPSQYSSSDCACRLDMSEEGPPDEEAAERRQQQHQRQENLRALTSAGDRSNSASGVSVSVSATASTGGGGGNSIYQARSSRRSRSRSRAQRFVNVYVAPLWGPRMAALRKRCSPLWLYTGMACASIVVAASFLLAPSAVAQLGPTSAGPLLLLTAGVRSRLADDEHAQPLRDAHLLPDSTGAAIADTEPPMDRSEDPFCRTQLVQEREKSWNESGLEFLSPRLVRNGSRAVLCFYDRRAHRLPPPYSYFPRQMALRYCTHAVYHAPFALHDGRLAYRNPGFDRKFGMPELARVARRSGYGTRLLFTVGGEETDNANWSRLASDSVQRDTLATDLKVRRDRAATSSVLSPTAHISPVNNMATPKERLFEPEEYR